MTTVKLPKQTPYILKNGSKRLKVLYNLMFYILNGHSSIQIYNEMIENSNNSQSLNGFLFETIIEILIITKCFIGLNYMEYMDGKVSDVLTKIEDINIILNKRVHSGNNICDIVLKTSTNEYVGISIKNYFKARGTDCEIIKNEFTKKGLNCKVSFITKDKNDVVSHKYLSEKEDYCIVMRDVIKNNLLFDKTDVVNSIEQFRVKYTIPKNLKYGFKTFIKMLNESIFNNSCVHLVNRFHQELTMSKFIQNYDNRYHLLPQVPRSGKSITMLLMAKYMIEVKDVKRILIMTSIPSTITSFIKDMNTYFEFNNIKYKTQGEKIHDEWCGIYFCSIQYLKMGKKSNKNEKMEFLKNSNFEALFSDEAHIGSSTDKSSKNIINLDEHDDDLHNIQKSIKKVIFVSGTPGKTKNFYNIKSKNVYEWGFIDNNLMKQRKYDLMEKRHGVLFKETMNKKNLDIDYSKYPTQILERFELNSFFKNQIIQYNEENNEHYGFTFDSLFELVQVIEKGKKVFKPSFKIAETEYGKDMLISILNHMINEHPMQRKNSLMYMVEKLQSKYDSRKSTYEKPKLFIMYLPTNSQFSNIEPLQKALYDFLVKNDLWCEYNIEYTNSKSNSLGYKYDEYSSFIEKIMKKTKDDKKKGCVLFLGNQGTTGITYHECDVTISLDNGKSLDVEKQKQARAMTDMPGKTIGINIDMNMQRCYSMVVDRCNQFKKITQDNKNNADILKYMYMNKLFVFDSSKMINMGECHESIITDYYEKVSQDIAVNIDDDIYLEELECDDMLNEFILDNKFVKSYMDVRNKEETEIKQQEIEELYNGLQQDIPVPEKEKVLAVIEKKKESIEEVEKEVEEEVEELVNKTLEVMKLWLMPFIIIMSIKYKYAYVSSLLDNLEIMGVIINVMKEKKIEFEMNKKNIVLIKEAMKSIIENNNDIVNNIREIYINAHPKQYRKLIEKHFVPTVDEKKNNAEVPTPVKLVDEMLEKIPTDFWTKQQKVFEPCCGKGNFVLGIFYKLYDGLKELYPFEYDRCKVIIEKCLYYADISTLNVFITTEILKCEVQSRCGESDFSEWKFNTYVGDTLELDIKDTFGVDGFDAVIGNPPYNSHGDTGTGNTIWQNFTRKSLDEWLLNEGYLVFVHPPGWRKPNTKRGKFYGMYEQMTKNNQMLYLSIHGIKDGQKTFNCGTRYDWYVIQKTPKIKNTIVNDENGKKLDIDMSDFEWLPNYNIDVVQKLLAKEGEEKCPIIYNRSNYGSDKKYTKKEKDIIHKYPIIHTIPLSGVRYIYSSCNNKGHFGISKVIFGDNGLNDVIIDYDGKYGMSENSMAIKIDSVQEGKRLKECLLNNNFKNIVKSFIIGNFRIDWRLFTYFKKDFWKEFV